MSTPSSCRRAGPHPDIPTRAQVLRCPHTAAVFGRDSIQSNAMWCYHAGCMPEPVPMKRPASQCDQLGVCPAQFMLTVWRRVFTPFQVAQITVQTYPGSADILAMIKCVLPHASTDAPRSTSCRSSLLHYLSSLQQSFDVCLATFMESKPTLPTVGCPVSRILRGPVLQRVGRGHGRAAGCGASAEGGRAEGYGARVGACPSPALFTRLPLPHGTLISHAEVLA